jgi:CRP/FNR family cyclic AMP-dependent transcriptional regulator
VDTGLGYPPEFASAVHQTDTFGALTSGSFARVEPAAIRDIGVFAEFDDEQCEQVAGACQELDVDAGTKLTEEGDFGYAMFAVLEGTADVSRNGEHIRTLGPGDVFGEIAVFFGGQRTATVTAKSPMRLVMLFNSELARLDHEVPKLADELRKVIGERLARDGR